MTNTLTDIGWVRGKNSFLLIAARVFGLCGLVVAVPLLDILGRTPPFFVAHNIDGAKLVQFAVAVIMVPAAVVIAGLCVVRIVARQAFPVITQVVIGTLAALGIVPIIDRAAHPSTVVFVILVIIFAVAAAWAYRRWHGFRSYTTGLAAVPILALVLFLVASPSSVLLGGTENISGADLNGSTTPVVLLVLDEFPLGLLMDTTGAIDEARFPGFARLADTSTWYPKALTVSPWTNTAVPALMTGLLPSEPAPIARSHPRSVFTLFARSHRLEVSEASVEQICPPELCSSAPRDDKTDLAHDTEVVFLHSLLPDGLAADWLPEIGERWGGFGDDSARKKDPTLDQFKGQVVDELRGEMSERPGRFAQWTSSMRAGGKRPGMWIHHSLLPHGPHEYLPDGRKYSLPDYFDHETSAATWVFDKGRLAVRLQRLALQIQLVDTLVSGMLDRLEEQGLLDDALVVVTADHGITFEPGHGPRGAPSGHADDAELPEARVRDDVLPVPLFIKYPAETAGRIDNRVAQTIDVLPTMVDALNVTIPPGWRFDGHSLLGKQGKRRAIYVTTDAKAEHTVVIHDRPDPFKMSRYAQSTFTGPSGVGHDLYRLQPYGAVVGTESAGIASGDVVGTATIDDAAAYEHADRSSATTPAGLQATVTGVADGAWVAVALNGTIAGVGPVYASADVLRVIAFLDPDLMREGRNTVEVFRINSTTSLSRLSTR